MNVEAIANQARPDLVRYLGKILDGSLAPPDSKQDVCQDAVLKLQELPTGKCPRTTAGIRKLLFIIARNCAIDLLRTSNSKRKGEVSLEGINTLRESPLEPADTHPNPEQGLLLKDRVKEQKQRVAIALSVLTPRERIIVKMRMNATFSMMAQRLGTPRMLSVWLTTGHEQKLTLHWQNTQLGLLRYRERG